MSIAGATTFNGGKIMSIELLNMDCMDYMREQPDNAFELAICDPEYGIGAGKQSNKSKFVKQKNGTKIFVEDKALPHKDWDDKPAGPEYFDELKRVSKNQIIWGVNYYDYIFGAGRIVWDKMNDHSDQNDCEIAYCSLNNRLEIVRPPASLIWHSAIDINYYFFRHFRLNTFAFWRRVSH